MLIRSAVLGLHEVCRPNKVGRVITSRLWGWTMHSQAELAGLDGLLSSALHRVVRVVIIGSPNKDHDLFSRRTEKGEKILSHLV